MLFDLDGTVVDTLDDLAASVNHALSRLGRPVRDRHEVRGFIGEGVRQLLKDCLGPAHESLTDQALSLFTPHYQEHCVDRSALYPGVRQTLDALARTRRLAMVTNKPEAPSRRILKALGVDDFFAVLVAGDTLPVKKPDPAPLVEAARRLGVPVGDSAMVGDGDGDMVAARAAGARAVGATFGFRSAAQLKAAGAEALVDRFEDLIPLLAGPTRHPG